jgi:hypothetical protein
MEIKEIKELEPLRITEETGDTIDVYLSQRHTPVAWKRKLYELIHKSGMSEDEAVYYLNTTPIAMELFYDIDRGLFAVEVEAGECCEVYNPYTGKEILNDNLPEKQQTP